MLELATSGALATTAAVPAQLHRYGLSDTQVFFLSGRVGLLCMQPRCALKLGSHGCSQVLIGAGEEAGGRRTQAAGGRLDTPCQP